MPRAIILAILTISLSFNVIALARYASDRHDSRLARECNGVSLDYANACH